jgi:hypothetical protein
MKKAWGKPQLLVFIRSKKEEAVLVACKASTLSTGWGNNNNRCQAPVVPCGTACESYVAS